MSAHLSSPVWDLIVASEPITALSLPHTPVHRIIFISAQSHRAWPKRTAVLSLSFSFFLHSFPAISVVPSLSSLSFTPFPFSVFWHFYFSGHCWFLSHPILFHNFTSFTPTFPVSSNVTSYLSPHSSLFFPFLFFSLSDNDTGKFTPVTFKDGTAWELSVNAAWGTGLVHALQHKGTLVHDEHCKWCKAGLVFMKSKPFKVVVVFFKISPVLVLIQ